MDFKNMLPSGSQSIVYCFTVVIPIAVVGWQAWLLGFLLALIGFNAGAGISAGARG